MFLKWLKPRYSFLKFDIVTALPPSLSLRSFPVLMYASPYSFPQQMTLRPDFGTNSCLFPPLPDIISPEIRLQVFTHRSYFARPTHIFEDHPDDPSPDNEKYEHLGDTVLGLAVTSLMLEMYPCLRVGPSTKIRALIVGNYTLAEISLKYKLPDRLRLHPAQAITLRASTHIQADVFESFIGGLYLDQGLDAVKQWLYPLFRPYAKAAYLIVRQQHGLPVFASSPRSTPTAGSDAVDLTTTATTTSTTGHLALFNQYLQKSNRLVEWVYSDPLKEGSSDLKMTPEITRGMKTTPVWCVKVLVDGEFYGKGRGSNKRAARNEAAKVGLKKMGVSV